MREAVQLYFSNYTNFSGRTSRRDYWLTLLFLLLGTVVLGLFRVNAVLTLWSVLNFIPCISMLVRRLHDRDFSAWLMLVVFIPAMGTFILLFLSALPGTPGFNRFGPATETFYADDYYAQIRDEEPSRNTYSRYEKQRASVYSKEETISDEEWEDF